MEPAIHYFLFLIISMFPLTIFAQNGDQGSGDKPVIAVYHFTSAFGLSYDFAMSAGTAVEAGFVRSGRFRVVERNRFGIIKDEDKFKEANTAEIVAAANKLGAKTLVTGHIIAATHAVGSSRGPLNLPGSGIISQISLAFKIIDVESGQIVKSETILGKGNGATLAEAMQKSYDDIDRQARGQVAEYLPQRFVFASEVEVDKKGRLKEFKIWAGNDQGIKKGDIIEIYEITHITNPATNKRVEEKKLKGEARIKEVHGAETSTCELVKWSSVGEEILNDIRNKSKTIVFEYKGTNKKKLFGNL